MQVFFMAAGKWLRDRDVVEHNFQLEGKQGERKAHYYITRARIARGKEKKKEKLELRIMSPHVICIQFALTP